MPVIYRSWHDSRKLHSPQELAEEIVEEQVQALVTEADFVFEEMFQGATCLRFLGVCRSSHSHVDLEAATRSGVAVAYTPHRNTVAVAELTLGLMLSLARGLPRLNCYVKAGRWQDPVEPYIEMRGQELAGRTLGVIGVGAIGGTVARLSRCLGMRVVGHDPFLAGSQRQRQRVPLVGLEELLEQSGHGFDSRLGKCECRNGPQCGAFGDDETWIVPDQHLCALGRRGVGLLEQLDSGRLAGAALDVHDTHPILPSSPLLHHDKVILTPHVGGATVETVRRHSWMMVEDIRRFVRGQRPLRLANPEVWAHRV